jgi:type II secretory pathway pseudopilin PulG
MQAQQGLTIIEILLVLVIASTLILMGLRQYQSYRFDADVAQLKYNVDTLFQSMLSYFRANCSGEGTLSPFKKPPVDMTSPYPIDIQNNLITPGFLDAKALLFNSLAEEKVPGDAVSAYNVQFRPQRVVRKSICPPGETTCAPSGYALLWNPEIRVYLNDPDKVDLISKILNAPCVDADWNEVPCSASSKTILFTHQVSFSNAKQTASSYWIMNPILDEFRDANTTYNTVLPGLGEDQYYYCGG